MDTAFIILIVCLCAVLVLVLLKYFHLKNEIRHFTKSAQKLKDFSYEQPIKVTTFDKDIVNLANVLNEHIEIQKHLGDEYRQSSKRVSNIISGISHDFRTPLTAALGYLQMIEKSGELSESSREYLSVATEKNKYLKELSDEFFELTKLEADNSEVEFEKINLSNFLSERLLEQYGWIEKKNFITDFNITDGIVISTNRHYLERILENVFSNAKKYAEKSLSLSLTQSDNKIKLILSNDINPEDEIDVSRIFEPFYRTASRTKNGSGLGLYVVKCLCKKLNINVSAQMDGSLFSIVLLIK